MVGYHAILRIPCDVMDHLLRRTDELRYQEKLSGLENDLTTVTS